MRCPACGTELPADARFCVACGAPISSISEMPTRVAPAEPVSPVATTTDRPSVRRPSTGVGRLAVAGALTPGAFTPGTVFAGRFRIIGLLGRGGMGEVYRADDLRLGPPVALKFLPPSLAKDPARRERFHTEVRLAREIAHPSVCRVYDIGEHDGRLYLSMEYVDGEDLGSLLHRIGRLPSDKALELAQQICAGLAAAHERNVIHRDLKPANVMIDGRGRARITDFGLAVSQEDVGMAGDRSGTPLYMAPEQVAGDGASVRSDIYALGLVLYEMFTGRRAFAAEDRAELLRQHAFDLPTPPSELVANLPPGVEAVILRCLEKDPGARPTSARRVAADLPGGDPLEAALAAGETPSPAMVAAAPTLGSLGRAPAWGLFASALGLLALAVLAPSPERLYRLVDLERSPDVLIDRALALLEQAGVAKGAAFTAYGYDANWTQLELEGKQGGKRTLEDWKSLATSNPSPVIFWYRTSRSRFRPLDGQGRVTRSDPPVTEPGMVSLVLDSTGRLQSLTVVPGDAAGASTEADWRPLLAASGLDPASLKPVEPTAIPAFFGDHRVAFAGAPFGPAVRVEGASLAGRVVSFEVIWPWTPKQKEAEAAGQSEWQDTVLVIATFVAWTVGFLLARRNLRLKRGDRRGAYLVAAFLFVVLAARLVLTAPLRGTIALEWDLLEGGIGRALFWAVAVGVVYLGLEPLVRRRWPGVLTAWARLLRGRPRDPLVGRDVLLGVLFGTLVFLCLRVEYLIPHLFGWPLPPPTGRVRALSLGAERVLAFLDPAFGSLTDGLGILFLLILLRLLLRRTWLACIAAAVLFSLIITWWDDPFWIYWPLALIRAFAWVALMLRLGLLGTLAALCAWYGLNSWPVRMDVAWLASWSLVWPFLLAGLAAWGFRIALGEKRPFGKLDLDA